MSRLRECFAPHWLSIQTALFPWLEEELGPLTEKQQQFVQTLEVIRVEAHSPTRHARPTSQGSRGRHVRRRLLDPHRRRWLILVLTRLRRVCDHAVASVHETVIQKTHHDRLVGHLSRDSTAIAAREKPATKDKPPAPAPRKRGRPKKGEERPHEPTRLQRQGTMTTPEMLADLPTACDVGTKKNSKGYKLSGKSRSCHRGTAVHQGEPS